MDVARREGEADDGKTDEDVRGPDARGECVHDLLLSLFWVRSSLGSGRLRGRHSAGLYRYPAADLPHRLPVAPARNDPLRAGAGAHEREHGDTSPDVRIVRPRLRRRPAPIDCDDG